MHSKIFQISTKPISVDERLSIESVEEMNFQDFADNIGDEVEEGDRFFLIENLVRNSNGMFTIGDVIPYQETLHFNGFDNFFDEWKRSIIKEVESLEKDSMWQAHKIRNLIDRTHLGISYRFFIEEFNGYLGPFSDLIDAIQNTRPSVLYIGSIIDFHY